MSFPSEKIQIELDTKSYWKLVELAAQLETPVEIYCKNVLLSVVMEASDA